MSPFAIFNLLILICYLQTQQEPTDSCDCDFLRLRATSTRWATSIHAYLIFDTQLALPIFKWQSNMVLVRTNHMKCNEYFLFVMLCLTLFFESQKDLMSIF